MNTLDLSMTIRKQAEKRKTIDLALLKQYVLGMANTINASASNDELSKNGYGWQNGNFHVKGKPSSIALANTILEGFMFMLDCYHGYNSRMWCAFTSQGAWYRIVTRLHEIDDLNGTKHYWRLLDRLEHGHNGECKSYHGASPPTEKELARAQYIHDKYVRVLGL